MTGILSKEEFILSLLCLVDGETARFIGADSVTCVGIVQKNLDRFNAGGDWLFDVEEIVRLFYSRNISRVEILHQI